MKVQHWIACCVTGAAIVALTYALRQGTSTGVVATAALSVPTVALSGPHPVASAPSALRPAGTLKVLPANEIIASFGTQADIWKYAKDGLTSTDPARVFEAKTAAHECYGFLSLQEDLGVFNGGGHIASMQGTLTPERQLAISSFTDRCQGFVRAGKAESLKLVKALKARGTELGGEVFAAQGGDDGKPLAWKASAMVLSRSPSAITFGVSPLSTTWAIAQGIVDPNDRRSELITAASMLASCDLGRDCSAAGYESTWTCALVGRCGIGLTDGWEEGMTPAEVEQVKAYRSQLVSAIRQRDLSLLGIKVPPQ